MKMLALAMAVAPILLGRPLGEPDARELVRKSLDNYQRDWRAAVNYTYTQRDVEMKSGAKSITVNQVVTIEGTPYERLIEKDGRPLTPAEELKEKEKYEKTLAERSHESPAERQKRIADYQKQRGFLKEVPDAFQFKLLGERTIEGRPAYLVECTPNPHYQPHNMSSRVFSKIQAKLYIDKQDLQWARAEADVMDTVSFGFILARVSKGSKILLERMRLKDGVWVVKRIDVNGTARIMMVKTRDLSEEITYSNYRLENSSMPSVQSSSNTAGLNNVEPSGR
ncbi:MAG: hypothetical protein M3Z85_03840 [Acidobacteriota bacterium]|nr:hypothetical protein [Acidobacteriota bacterium]